MALPIDIKELIEGRTIESERIEYKEGWNPQKILHTMCAFANDINNWGGGYIIIGIKEENGKPVLPPEGIDSSQVDKWLKQLLNMGKQRIFPEYFPLHEVGINNTKQQRQVCFF